MTEITINWNSGPITYSYSTKHYPTYQTKPLLMEISEIKRGYNLDYTFENPTLKCELSNHQGHFTTITKNEDPIGKEISVKDGTTIFKGYICDTPDTDNPNRYSIKADMFSKLETPINLEISKERFPAVPDGNQGWGNILYGTASVNPGMMKATLTDTNQYHASFTNLSEFLDIINKDGASILSETTQAWDSEKKHTYINYASQDAYIRFSAKGPLKLNQSNLIENPAEMLQQLVFDFSTNFELQGVEEAAPIFDERQYQGNTIFIDDGMTWIEFFKLYAQNFNCRVFPTKDGKIKIKVIRWGMEIPKMTIHPSFIKGFKFRRDRSAIRKKWMRQYYYDPYERKYNMTEWDIDGGNSEKIGEFKHKFHNLNLTSRDVALRESFFKKRPILVYVFSIPRQYANQIDIGDTILFSHRNNIFFKNESRQVEILRETRKPGSGFVIFEGYDMTEINKRTFILREPGHPEVAVLGEGEGPTLW